MKEGREAVNACQADPLLTLFAIQSYVATADGAFPVPLTRAESLLAAGVKLFAMVVIEPTAEEMAAIEAIEAEVAAEVDD